MTTSEIEYVEVLPQLKRGIAEMLGNLAGSSGLRRGRSREIKEIYEKIMPWLNVSAVISETQWAMVQERVRQLAEPSRDSEQFERDLIQLVLFIHSCRH